MVEEAHRIKKRLGRHLFHHRSLTQYLIHNVSQAQQSQFIPVKRPKLHKYLPRQLSSSALSSIASSSCYAENPIHETKSLESKAKTSNNANGRSFSMPNWSFLSLILKRP